MGDKKISNRTRQRLDQILSAKTEQPQKTPSPTGVTVAEVAETIKLISSESFSPCEASHQDQQEESVELALSVIEEATQKGYRFTDKQRDIGIKMSLRCLPESERDWFIEIAEKIAFIPYWQCLWGQFRRCHEWGLANAPLLDVGWDQGELGPLAPRECEWCHKSYVPTDRKQDVCSNYCGGQKELHRLGMDSTKQLEIEASVGAPSLNADGDPETLEDLVKEPKQTVAVPDLPPLGPESEKVATEV